MHTSILQLSLVTTIIAAGLSSGITFAFSNFVMRGLDRMPAEHAIRAMQHINETVINPAFLLVFMATGVLAAVVAGAHARAHGGLDPWLVVGAAAYLVGVVGVTIVGNVPLNDSLAAVDPTQTPDAWSQYYGPWLRWNHVRWVAAAVTVGTFTMGMNA